MHVLMLWLTFNTGSLNIEILSTIIIDTTYLLFFFEKFGHKGRLLGLMLGVPDPIEGIITHWISYADIGVLITCSSWHSCCSCLRLDWLLCLEPDCEMVWLYIFSRWDWYLCRFANPSLARRTGENLSFGRCKEFAKEFGAKKISRNQDQ